MHNPRTNSKPSSTSSPARPRNCNSPTPSGRPSSADGEELVKTSWSGYKRVVQNTVTSNHGQPQTRIPRLPRGKENLRGRGARVVKPVARPKNVTANDDPISESNEDAGTYTSSFKSNITVNSTPIKPGARSPVYISSKAVPDLHNKILAKIRLNKRRFQSRSLTTSAQSPCKATTLQDGMDETNAILKKEDEYESDRESPVSGQDLETYLASMFYMVDTYRTGLLTAGSLLEYLGGLVDLPKLDKWKLEELSRLLDPDKDNRYVDQALWNKVGQAWLEMMMDPGNHVDTSTVVSDEVEDIEDIPVDQDVLGNASYRSYGSVEGVGGAPGCYSRGVELETKVSELKYQLTRLGEDKLELERNLTGSEELAQNLATELEGSQRVMVHISSSFHRGEIVYDEDEQVKEVQEQCCTLAQKVEDLTKKLHDKDEKLVDMEVMLVTIRDETEECRLREELLKKKLEDKSKRCVSMEADVKAKLEQVHKERAFREEVEGKLEVTQSKLQQLEMELSLKAEEICNLTETGRRIGSVESIGNMSSSMIHDVSVDDRVIEENLNTQPGATPLLITPSRVTYHSPVVRGPSASSTPHKGRKGSIADELYEMEASNGFPYPLCEKKEKGARVKSEVIMMVEMMGESVRRIMVNQVKPVQSGRAMVLLNREIANVKKELDVKFEILSSSEDLKELQDKAFDLEEKLSEAKLVIENLESAKANEQAKNDMPAEAVEQVENRVEALARLLHSTNSAMLAVAETPPDCSLDQETDLSNWQPDLEGIQLVDWNSQLGKRLAHYTRCGKKSSLAEVSCRSPMAIGTSLLKPSFARSPAPSGLLWQSLYKRLEDLQSETEVSRDLLIMAGDSMREQSVNQSSIMFPKTVSCQTSTLPSQTKASQADARPQTASQSAQTDLFTTSHNLPFTTCPVENCFCSSSQTNVRASWWSRLCRTAGVQFECFRLALGDWLPTPVILLSYKTFLHRSIMVLVSTLVM